MTSVKVNIADLTLMAVDTKAAIREHKKLCHKAHKDAYDLALQEYMHMPWYLRWFTPEPCNPFASKAGLGVLTSTKALRTLKTIEAYEAEYDQFDWLFDEAQAILTASRWSCEETIEVDAHLLWAFEVLAGKEEK